MSSDLGAFSISLSVRDLDAAIAFYEKLGFSAMGGGADWRMMKMGDKVIGLFQGMFEKNMLTFNPGWTQHAENLDSFTDIRALQSELRARGLTLTRDADPDGTGPASITLEDPDGNPILIDQHR